MALNIWRVNKRYFSLSKLLSLLEDPRYPSVGPHLRLLGLTGIWQPKKTKIKQCIFYITVGFFFSQYVKCVIKFHPVPLKLILQYAPFHLGVVKACFFQKDFKKWKSIIDYVSDVECKEIAGRNDEKLRIITEYIKRSRKITYFFWALAFFSNFAIFSEPYQKNQAGTNGTGVYLKVLDGYTPFSDEPPGYYFSMLVQTVLGHMMSVYVVGWDTLVLTIMIFLKGQLRIMRLNYANIIDVKDADKSRNNIMKCHRFHVTFVKYQKLFNSLISPAMFVYLILVSVNLGVCIIEIAQLQDDLKTLISSCLFVVACLIQLLLFFWHSNEVTEESTLVSYGTFESDWVEMDVKCQKEVALLGLTTRTRLVFKAGPFNEMSLNTFIAVS
uniref:Odorant receptor n=1 Tax=Glyphodes pyloalis TaxID=1242752 RepID=A0A6M3GRV9_GLYPY|nr:olfactory receptor [Glyphodes pyloalis]